MFWQKTRCKNIGSIVFGYTLHKEQIDAIQTLFYQPKDLLLFTKIGFGKNSIFQLILFITLIFGVVLILMPLKLLQVKQSEIISKKLPNSYSIVLNSDNNKESIWCEIAKGYYTYVFTSLEIALFKKFKKNILDYYLFSDWLYLLVVDEIHLIKEWNK